MKPPEAPAERRRRVYSAGYRAGQRLSSIPLSTLHRCVARTTDPHLVELGANAYAEGFEDGHAGRVPACALVLSDLDNHFLGARLAPAP